MIDEETKQKIREQNAAMGEKIGAGFKGRLPGELPQPPGYIPDPEPVKPADPKFYKDRDNPRIRQIKKEE